MNYARWATKDEVAKRLKGVNLETGVDKGGIPIGYDDNYLYIDNSETQSLIIGSTGSGKTQSTIMPMLKLAMFAGESIVLNDPLGDIYKRCASALKDNGYNVIALDFNDAKLGNCWNPLKFPYELYKSNEKDQAIKVLEDLAYYLFYDGKDKNSDPFWINTVIDYFTGLTLYSFENYDEDKINLKSIFDLSLSLNEKDSSIVFLDKIDKNSRIYLNLVGTLKAPIETKGSIFAVFNQKMKKYISRETLTDMLSNSDFDIKEISNQKTALFIVSGVSSYCNNLIPLIVNQIIDSVSLYGKKEKTLNILLDEFDSMVPIKDFASIISYCRSIRIKLAVTIRSYIHLSNMYTKEDAEILKMCFGNIIYLLSDDIYTLEELSKYCGNKRNNEPLITVEELKTLSIFEAIVLIPRTMPYKTKLLPDYQIDWGVDFKECQIPSRKIN